MRPRRASRPGEEERALPRPAGELEHRYGPRVRVLDELYVTTALARFSSPDAGLAESPRLLRSIYHALLVAAVGRECGSVETEVETRMAEHHPREGVWRGSVLDPASRIVVVDVLRAGILPAQTCYELLAALLPAIPPGSLRLDHLNLARISDASGRVIGADLSGSKIGGRIDGALVLFPDPMGATGATTKCALHHYLEHFGRPARIVAMPMIATPEYLRAVLDEFEDLVVCTARIDRGLSPPDVLACVPGERWAEERGLDEHGYIVPGAGGVGEVLNNSWC